MLRAREEIQEIIKTEPVHPSHLSPAKTNFSISVAQRLLQLKLGFKAIDSI